MILKTLSLINYKNIKSLKLSLNPRINCFVGDNGVGKTNILDAIYHLSFGKSYFNPITTQNIRHGSDFFVVEGTYKREDREEQVTVSFKRGHKKTVKRNGKPYPKISEHIGFLPLVIISPADRDLITEGSDVRRKFVDGVISQGNSKYLHALLSYGKLIEQRNSLLKYFAASHTFNSDTLEAFDMQLDQYGSYIYTERKKFLDLFIPIVEERYAFISEDKDRISMSYQSQLEGTTSLKDLLKSAVQKDAALQYTSVGTHKDDLDFLLNSYPIKKFGSQGQQKTFLVALKLAQFDFIKKQKNKAPLLLLDDIFDKLDESRVRHILKLVEDNHFGQLFISDTHIERTENVVKTVAQSYSVYTVQPETVILNEKN